MEVTKSGRFLVVFFIILINAAKIYYFYDMKIFLWILRIIAAGILLQTLYFKFSGAPEPVYIFETIGVEPWGRYATGIAELVASVMILWPRFTKWGALLGIAIMAGAVISHLTVLGIEVKNDGGLLFGMGIAVLVACVGMLLILRMPDID